MKIINYFASIILFLLLSISVLFLIRYFNNKNANGFKGMHGIGLLGKYGCAPNIGSSIKFRDQKYAFKFKNKDDSVRLKIRNIFVHDGPDTTHHGYGFLNFFNETDRDYLDSVLNDKVTLNSNLKDSIKVGFITKHYEGRTFLGRYIAIDSCLIIVSNDTIWPK